jgi:citrate synthase
MAFTQQSGSSRKPTTPLDASLGVGEEMERALSLQHKSDYSNFTTIMSASTGSDVSAAI